jgi:RNA polymerase sigma factor (sigma-70 family)
VDSEDPKHEWFVRNVQAHEPALRSYLQSHFPSLSEIDDVVQESYRRLIRTMQEREVGYPKAYLFATARNAALDLFRKKRMISIEEIPHSEQMAVLEDRPGVAESVNHDQELQLLAEAIEDLPKRCRQVLKLRKIYGLSHEEIAQQLGISKATVATQIHLGVRRCGEFLEARGVRRESNHEGSPTL